MTDLRQDAAARPAQGTPAEVLAVFLRLGLTSFGGPIAHLGYFRDELVTRRRWLDDAAYADLVALCQFLPGPASSQVGFALGMMRAGWPGALAAFAGAGIAGGDPMRTGFQALKLSLAGFIVPFLFVYNPAMLMIDTTNVAVNAREFAFPAWTTIVSITVTSVIGILALGAAVEGYFKTGLNWFWRIFMGVGALMMIIPETYTDIAGTIMVVIAVAVNVLQARKQKSTPSGLSSA